MKRFIRAAWDGILRTFFRYGFWIVPWWWALTVRLTRPRVKGLGKGYLPIAVDRVTVGELLGWGTKYRPDPLRGLVDNMSHPQRVQLRIDQGKLIGDCDDHAIYWATMMLRSGLASRVWLGVVHFRRKLGKGKWVGHVLAVWEDANGKQWWADYSIRPSDPLPHNYWVNCFAWVRPSTAARLSAPIAAAMVPVQWDGHNPRFGKPEVRVYNLP